MNLDDNVPRKVIPRWHSINFMPRSFSQWGKRSHGEIEDNRFAYLRAKYLVWKESPSLRNALEVLDNATLLGDVNLVVGPLKQVSSDTNAPKSARAIAEQLLRPKVELMSWGGAGEDLHARVRAIKSRLQGYPRSPLLWVERARLHTLLGQQSSASEAFTRALAIAPNHRIVLRSFARFSVHRGDPDRAHRTIISNGNLISDPWIQATEIALAELCDRSAVSAAHCKRLLNSDDVDPSMTTEAASSLATLELGHHGPRRAKRLFEKSLREPNDNALSQAAWASASEKVDLYPHLSRFDISDPEAQFYKFSRQKEWRNSLLALSRWQHWEPYSSHIAITASFISSSYLGDYDFSSKICERALESNNHSPSIHNNLAVALFLSNKLERARSHLDAAKSLSAAWLTDPTLIATSGMQQYRCGNHEEGSRFYNEAVDILLKNDKEKAALAFCYWINEEYIAGICDTETALKLFNTVKEKISRIKIQSSVTHTIEQFRHQIETRNKIADSEKKSVHYSSISDGIELL